MQLIILRETTNKRQLHFIDKFEELLSNVGRMMPLCQRRRPEDIFYMLATSDGCLFQSSTVSGEIILMTVLAVAFVTLRRSGEQLICLPGTLKCLDNLQLGNGFPNTSLCTDLKSVMAATPAITDTQSLTAITVPQ